VVESVLCVLKQGNHAYLLFYISQWYSTLKTSFH